MLSTVDPLSLVSSGIAAVAVVVSVLAMMDARRARKAAEASADAATLMAENDVARRTDELRDRQAAALAQETAAVTAAVHWDTSSAAVLVLTNRAAGVACDVRVSLDPTLQNELTPDAAEALPSLMESGPFTIHGHDSRNITMVVASGMTRAAVCELSRTDGRGQQSTRLPIQF